MSPGLAEVCLCLFLGEGRPPLPRLTVTQVVSMSVVLGQKTANGQSIKHFYPELPGPVQKGLARGEVGKEM